MPRKASTLEELYEDHYKVMIKIAKGWLGNDYWAEEVVQETFCIAQKQLEKVLTHEKPRAWLMKTLKHKIQESRRIRDQEVRMLVTLDFDVPSEDKAEERLYPSLIAEVRDALPEELWYVLRRHVLEGATHLEIAKELDITVSSSQKRLERAKKRLRKLLGGKK